MSVSSSHGGASVQVSVDGRITENIGAFPPRIVPYFRVTVCLGEASHITVEQTFGAHQPFDLANQLRPNYPTHLHSDDKRRSELSVWFRLAVNTVGYNISPDFLDALHAGDEDLLAKHHFPEMMAHTANIQCIRITLHNTDGSEPQDFRPDRPYDKHFHLEALPEKPGWWGVVEVLDASSATTNPGCSREATPLSTVSSPSLTDLPSESFDNALITDTANNLDLDEAEDDAGTAPYGVIKIRPTFDWQTAEREILPVLAGIDMTSGRLRKVINPVTIETAVGTGRITHRGSFYEITEGVFSANPSGHRM